jgi:molecular chaperone HscB
VAAENPSPSEALDPDRATSSPGPFDPSLDHFARFGLERRWTVDRDALERRYLERSRQVHPDRFVGADSGTRRAALEHSSALNSGYRILRDPVARAEYLVKLGGLDLDSSDPQTGAPHPDQAFLIDMIERRERLAEIRESGSDTLDALDDLQDEIEAELEAVLDRALAALEREDIRAAAAALVHRRYLDRFITEVQAAAQACP